MTLPPSSSRPAHLLGLAVTAALSISAATAAPAFATNGHHGTILGANDRNAVAGSYIVAFRDATMRTASIAPAATSLAAAHGGTAGHVFQYALHGFEFVGDAAGAAAIAADPRVKYVQQSHRFHITDAGAGTQTSPGWDLDRLDQKKLPLDRKYNYPGDGAGVTAYVVDTGIRYTHTEFGGRAVKGIDTQTPNGDANDCHSHGTHVAGSIGAKTYGVAKAVKLVGVRVMDCKGSGDDPQIIAGLDWIAANATGPSVVNMSIGGDPSQGIDDAVNKLIAKNIVVAVAAGNGDDLGNPQDACNYSPARVPDALTVAATSSDDSPTWFTNYGKCVDIFAPGENIKSATNTSDTATTTKDGTSQACPHVVGAAALIMAANPTFTPAQVAASLAKNASAGVVRNPKAGTPNLLLNVG